MRMAPGPISLDLGCAGFVRSLEEHVGEVVQWEWMVDELHQILRIQVMVYGAKEGCQPDALERLIVWEIFYLRVEDIQDVDLRHGCLESSVQSFVTKSEHERKNILPRKWDGEAEGVVARVGWIAIGIRGLCDKAENTHSAY